MLKTLSRRHFLGLSLFYYLLELIFPLLAIPIIAKSFDTELATMYGVLIASLSLSNLVYSGFSSVTIRALSMSYTATKQMVRFDRELWLGSGIILVAYLACLRLADIPSSNIGLAALFGFALLLKFIFLMFSGYFLSTHFRGWEKICQLLGSIVQYFLFFAFILFEAKFEQLILIHSIGGLASVGLLFLMIERTDWVRSKNRMPFSHTEYGRFWSINGLGFLNLGIESFLYSRFLPSSLATEAILLSRVGQSPLALISLWCQSNFSIWSAGHSSTAYDTVCKAVYYLLGAGTLFTALVFSVWPPVALFALIPETMALLMILSYVLAGAVVLIGSYLALSNPKARLVTYSLPSALVFPLTYLVNRYLHAEWLPVGLFSANLLLALGHIKLLRQSPHA